jgi:two-component system, OmpR family, response regulator BaeR
MDESGAADSGGAIVTADGTSRILIAEDEPKLATLLSDYLVASGFETTCVTDGSEVIPVVKMGCPDLLILDLMLPHRNGLDICRELRTFSSLPLVMVTARVDEIDRLLGLEVGADDYICKPFSAKEVVARVKAILRRVSQHSGPGLTAGLSLDDAGHVAVWQGKTLDLTPVEFRLLKTLAASPRRVFSRTQLLQKLYMDHRIVTDRTVDSHIRNLRRKLQEVSPERELIESVYGVGYKLEW